MEDQKSMVQGVNVFIDYEIILNSPVEELKKDMDTIIALQNKIFVWSKNHLPAEMRMHCLRTEVVLPEDEREKHVECFRLRNIECLSYDEITEKTGVNARMIGFFAAVNPEKKWTLDDWVVDYLKKDSSIYPKVDFIIDPNPRMVERFEKIGIPGNVVDKL